MAIAMDSEGLQHRRLLQNLNESRRRFQTYMQRLIAKYNQPFEDDPLVEISTLTYETPQGLKVWGGKLIKESNKEQTQVFSVNTMQKTAYEMKCSLFPASESSSAETSLDLDILLQGAEYFKNVEKGDGRDTLMTWVPSLTTPVTPAPGCQDTISKKSFGPEVSTSSSRDQGSSNPCPADMTFVLRDDSFSLLGTSSNSLSSQSFDVDDTCSVTISDLYEGMMHSMSRLLSSKPSCIISTKTHINQNWKLRRRPSLKGWAHKNKTYCHRSKPFRRSSKKSPVPCSEPGKEAKILSDRKNLLNIVPHKTGLNRENLERSKLQVHKFSPDWKELQVMPQKFSDVNTVCLRERENRVEALQWLISPVKIVPRPRMRPSLAEIQYRETKIKFDKLHREYCLSSGKLHHPAVPTESWSTDMNRSGCRSLGSSQGIETHRPSLPFNREKAKSQAAFEDPSEMSVKADRCPPRSHLSPSLSEDSPLENPGYSQQMSGLFLQEHNSGPIRKAVLPSKAISAPWIGPQGFGKNRYDEIKKEFDRLYQKYCLMSPQRVKMTSCVRVSPMKAGAAVPSQMEDLRKLNPDSRFQSSPKLSTSGQRIRSPQHSPALEARKSAWTVSAVARDPQLPTKRRKLSYPPECTDQAKS
ncbi:Holliday junction recognition protein [Acomys russatus]|uniref:Holliday junction recognition protein n=1 Tax=Acomys russatus TaxID=60746 RepID=UPI0021E2FFB6|nr:Holliday junction recognition protein [Acomys russatus]